MGGKVDLNPMNSSLFTGKGLPWGPTETAEPGDMPAAPRERSRSEFQAFDQSELVNRLISGLRAGQGRQEQGALRRASRLGVAQSDAARRGMQDIAAGIEDRIAGIEAGAAKEAWDDITKQKQFAEQMDINRYNQAMAAWQMKKALRDQELSGRRSALMLGADRLLNNVFGA